jgi:V/A-type H+-transporting ATPase subunit C
LSVVDSGPGHLKTVEFVVNLGAREKQISNPVIKIPIGLLTSPFLRSAMSGNTLNSIIGGQANAAAAPGISNTRYVCTRLRVRRKNLIKHDDYMRMLNMSIPQIARFIGENGYAKEIHTLAGSRSEIDRIEIALVENLAASCQDVRSLTSGSLILLTDWYLHRWDIVNVMIILRGKKRGLPHEKIREILIPAGDLGPAALAYLLEAGSYEEVIERLSGWRLYPVLSRECRPTQGRCLFSHLENRLYQEYYTDLIRNCRTGIPGADLFLEYIRLEIDLINFRNLIRLRSGPLPADIGEQMVDGGTIPLRDLRDLSAIQEGELFIEAFRKSPLHPLLVDSYRTLFPDAGDPTIEAEKFISGRWVERKRPLHEMEMAVTRVRLTRMEQLSKRHPFSVLPVLVYLERKKYEVFNIRAIVRGIEDGVPAEQIQRYLVT